MQDSLQGYALFSGKRLKLVHRTRPNSAIKQYHTKNSSKLFTYQTILILGPSSTY